MEHTIDAQGKKLGRIATAAATMLMGKDRTDFVRNAIPDVKVSIINAGKIWTSNKKMEEKIYTTYSGYPGGLKEETYAKVKKNKGMQEIVKKAVYGMLPDNKLRPIRMKRLTITD